jgi:hypothetical protein
LELKTQPNSATIGATRARTREQHTKPQWAERKMNQIIETNVVELETSELNALIARQTEDAITELNSAQLMLVGGGSATILLI